MKKKTCNKVVILPILSLLKLFFLCKNYTNCKRISLFKKYTLKCLGFIDVSWKDFSRKE